MYIIPECKDLEGRIRHLGSFSTTRTFPLPEIPRHKAVTQNIFWSMMTCLSTDILFSLILILWPKVLLKRRQIKDSVLSPSTDPTTYFSITARVMGNMTIFRS